MYKGHSYHDGKLMFDEICVNVTWHGEMKRKYSIYVAVDQVYHDLS